jgi:hypothetical protein
VSGLGQYFQVARGYGATEAGLLTIPMMFASFLGSVSAGQLITPFGTWKRYLALGGPFLTAGQPSGPHPHGPHPSGPHPHGSAHSAPNHPHPAPIGDPEEAHHRQAFG